MVNTLLTPLQIMVNILIKTSLNRPTDFYSYGPLPVLSTKKTSVIYLWFMYNPIEITSYN